MKTHGQKRFDSDTLFAAAGEFLGRADRAQKVPADNIAPPSARAVYARCKVSADKSSGGTVFQDYGPEKIPENRINCKSFWWFSPMFPPLQGSEGPVWTRPPQRLSLGGLGTT